MTVLAWHFVGSTLRDGRPIPADGKWLVHDGPIIICGSGLHASRRPADALKYAPGETLCLVECGGVFEEHDDKLVCRRRRIVSRMDATDMLRYYARMQAIKTLEFWPDPPDVVLDWLMSGDESLRSAAWHAAWHAARRAARSAARSAAGDAARSAARSAAGDAAWDAARRAAWDAAQHAAWHAAWDAAQHAAWDEFDALVHECFADFLPAEAK